MASNFVKPNDIVTFTAPSGGVVSGTPYLIGNIIVVALATVAQTLPFEGDTVGVWILPKITGVAWTEGMLLYWDTATSKFGTVVSATTSRQGCAAAAALSGDTTGQVRLNGIPSLANVA